VPGLRPAARAVIFDIDDTLLDYRDGSARGLRAYLRQLDPRLDTAAVRLLWDRVSQRYYRQFLEGELSFAEQRRRRVREFCHCLGLPLGSADADADEWMAGYSRCFDAALGAVPGAEHVLSELTARGLILGALSNGSQAEQRRKLTNVGLMTWFQALTCADTAGAAKPDPLIFRSACSELAVTPSQAVYVGDQLDVDARAADRAGLHGVWFNRGDEEAADTVTIHNLAQLLDPAVTRCAAADPAGLSRRRTGLRT
jgi:putative hydrolase of the HAD superfamily